MKKTLNILFRSFITAMLIMTVACVPVMAADKEYTEDGEQAVPVTASIASSYSVTVPASLSLTDDGTGKYVGECSIGAKGLLPSNECVYIKPKEGTRIKLHGGGESVTAELGQKKFTWGRNPAAQMTLAKDSYTRHEFDVTADLSGKSGRFRGEVTYMFGKSFLVSEEDDYDSSHDPEKTAYTGAEVLDIIKNYAGKKSFSVKVSNQDSERIYINSRDGAGRVSDHIEASTESGYVSEASDPASAYYIDPSAIYILRRVTTDTDYDGGEDSVTYTVDFEVKTLSH